MAEPRPGRRACGVCFVPPGAPSAQLPSFPLGLPGLQAWLAASGQLWGRPGPGIPHGAELRARKEQEPVGEFLVLSCACSALCMWGGGAGTERSHAGLGPRVPPCPGTHWGWRKLRGSKGPR